MYNQLVRSKLEYGCITWDPHNKGEQRQLEVMQKRAYKFILNKAHIDNYSLFLKENNILSLHERRKYMHLCMMYKIFNGLVDIPFNDHLKLVNFNPFNLRKPNSKQLQARFPTTNSYKFSFYPRSIHDWNNLPEQIANASSFDIFKSELNQHLLDKHNLTCDIYFNL